jgi:hypothetical protein
MESRVDEAGKVNRLQLFPLACILAFRAALGVLCPILD